MSIFVSLLALLPAITSPSVSPAPIVTPVIVPPIVATMGNWKTEPVVVRFMSGDAMCNGVVHNARQREEPLPAGFTRLIRAGTATSEPAAVGLTFDLDAAGRPGNIRAEPVREMGGTIDVRDVAPALSLWRFAPGAARRNCRISFAVRTQPVASAELPLLYRYLALQRPNVPGFNATVGRAAFNRILPAGSNCRGMPSNGAREQHHPAFETIPQKPGTASYAFLGFDIAPDGATRNVRVLSSDGNADLDRQSVAALAKWRFPPGERTGCLYSYYRKQTLPVAAPEPRPLAAHVPAGARCRAEPRWIDPLKPAYPPQFNRRAIEGWAVIGYDIAPWGATGNVRIIASEPAEQFGEQAASTIRRALKPAGATGYTGCVQRVRFVTAREGEPPTAATD